MSVSVVRPRFQALGQRPIILFVMDSFGYVRSGARWECWVQAFLEHLYFLRLYSVALVLPGAYISRGDYLDALLDHHEFLDDALMIVIISMGNDLIGSVRPVSVVESAADVISSLQQLRALIRQAQILRGYPVLLSLVYGGSGSVWGYEQSVADAFDHQVRAVLSGVRCDFDFISTGQEHLGGVVPVDAIGHLRRADVPACARVLWHSFHHSSFRSRL